MENCPGCGALQGEAHRRGCDIEVCSVCRRPRVWCLIKVGGGCRRHDPRSSYWAGFWPGILECRERGWFARRVRGGDVWEPCAADEPGASEDLNRWKQYQMTGEDRLYGAAIPTAVPAVVAAGSLRGS